MTSYLKKLRIAIVGGGNMSGAIIGGLIKNKMCKESILICEPNKAQQERLFNQYGVASLNSAAELDVNTTRLDAIVLGVKPHIVKHIIQKDLVNVFKSQTSEPPCVLSVAAGVKTKTMRKWLPESKSSDTIPIIRTMPNTPCLINEGFVAAYSEKTLNETQLNTVNYVLKSITNSQYNGILWVNKESELDSVTALGGSSPAYFFHILEAMEKGGVNLGLDKNISRRIASISMLGAVKMVLQNIENVDLSQLRKNVTSSNGTTHAALQVMFDRGLEKVVIDAVRACHNRSVEIGNELDKI